MNEITARVFRRNPKNIIIVWNVTGLDMPMKRPVVATIIDEGKETLLAYSRFIPDSPEKFPRGTDGIIISHVNNNLDPNKAYKIKLSFGDSEPKTELIKDVSPTCVYTAPEAPKDIQPTHMYAYDYKKCKWVPLPVDQSLIVEGNNA